MALRILALVFELCRGKEIRERKTRLSRFEFAFVRETEIVLFVLCMCAIRVVVLHPPSGKNPLKSKIYTQLH